MSVTDDWSETTESGASFAYAFGGGYWVGVAALIRYADDPGGPWVSGTGDLTGDETFFGVAYADGKWVAVGNDFKIVTATTPSTWSDAASSGDTPYALYDVAYGDGKWVTVGGLRRVYSASDPTGTWTSRLSIGNGAFYGVAYGGGDWVAVGSDGTIRTASDPTGTWSTPSSVPAAPAGVYDRLFTAVAYGDGEWLAVGRDLRIGSITPIAYTATDPSGTWSAATPGGDFDVYSYGGVRYLDDTWIVRGYVGTTTNELRYATSVGGPWASVSLGDFTNGAYAHVAFDGQIFAGAGGDGIIYQPTGGAGWGLTL